MALLSEPVVAYPRKTLPFSLIVGAATGNEKNEGGLGAILCQTDNKGNNKAMAYASRQLLEHEKSYKPFLFEMAAIVWAMEHFNRYLKGRTFTVYNDYKPLYAQSKKNGKTLSRLQEAYTRWNFNNVYKKRSEMSAGYLSRNKVEAIRMSDKDLADKQNTDTLCMTVKNIMKDKTISLLFKKILKPTEN
jgi:hypothetical protein